MCIALCSYFFQLIEDCDFERQNPCRSTSYAGKLSVFNEKLDIYQGDSNQISMIYIKINKIGNRLIDLFISCKEGNNYIAHNIAVLCNIY